MEEKLTGFRDGTRCELHQDHRRRVGRRGISKAGRIEDPVVPEELLVLQITNSMDILQTLYCFILARGGQVDLVTVLVVFPKWSNISIALLEESDQPITTRGQSFRC